MNELIRMYLSGVHRDVSTCARRSGTIDSASPWQPSLVGNIGRFVSSLSDMLIQRVVF